VLTVIYRYRTEIALLLLVWLLKSVLPMSWWVCVTSTMIEPWRRARLWLGRLSC